MEMNEYQSKALEAAIYPNDGKISYLTLALCGEVGEVADKVKKVMRDKEGRFYSPDITAIALELGDALWYIANIAHILGFKLSDIAELNLKKIKDRADRDTIHGSGD